MTPAFSVELEVIVRQGGRMASCHIHFPSDAVKKASSSELGDAIQRHAYEALLTAINQLAEEKE